MHKNVTSGKCITAGEGELFNLSWSLSAEMFYTKAIERVKKINTPP